jgi:hypothetical protein
LPALRIPLGTENREHDDAVVVFQGEDLVRLIVCS